MTSRAYSWSGYRGMRPARRVRLNHAHMVLVHVGCGGIVDPSEQYYDWMREDVLEHQYCHKCDDFLSLSAAVDYVPRRKQARMQAVRR